MTPPEPPRASSGQPRSDRDARTPFLTTDIGNTDPGNGAAPRARLDGRREPKVGFASRPPRRPPLVRRRFRFASRRRLRIAIAVSLLIHVVVGILLLVTIRHHTESELLPPPSAVTMVFENGRQSQPTTPQPQPQTSIPQSIPKPPQEAPGMPEPPIPVTPPPPNTPPLAAPPPVVEPPPLPPPPLPKPVPPPPIAAPAPEAIPRPTPPPLRSPPITPPPKPPAAVKRAPPAPSTDFPPPMNFSLGNAVPRSRFQPLPHPPGQIDLSLGPAKQGPANNTPHADIDSDNAGPDWRNALSMWVAQHAYYPEQARRDHEQGEAKVHVVAAPNGHVTSVELIGKSGSMWLDLALQALFRDANIPPVPSGTMPIEFNFTMHYILRYR